MEHNNVIVELRKIASLLRGQAAEFEKQKTEKCAQALIAARGLNQLQRIIAFKPGELS